MFNGRFNSSGYVGIDLGVRSIKMLQVREHGGTLRVVGASRFDAMPDKEAGSELGLQVQRALAAGGFTGRACAIALPRSVMRIQAIRLPAMSDTELVQAVRWEAAQRFDLDHKAIEADFIRTGATMHGKETREEILLVAASHEDIYAYVDPLVKVGLRPVAIDLASAALARVFSRRARRDADRDVVRAILEVGYRGSTVLILSGSDISFCKAIDLGGWHFNKAVAEHLHIDQEAASELRLTRLHARQRRAEADANNVDAATDRAVYESVRPLMNELARELTMCLRYYGVTFRGAPPRQIILAGGDCLEPKLKDTLSAACNIEICFDDEVETLQQLYPMICEKLRDTAGAAGDWAVGAGLSMRAMLQKRAERRTRQTRKTRMRGAA